MFDHYQQIVKIKHPKSFLHFHNKRIFPLIKNTIPQSSRNNHQCSNIQPNKLEVARKLASAVKVMLMGRRPIYSTDDIFDFRRKAEMRAARPRLAAVPQHKANFLATGSGKLLSTVPLHQTSPDFDPLWNLPTSLKLADNQVYCCLTHQLCLNIN